MLVLRGTDSRRIVAAAARMTALEAHHVKQRVTLHVAIVAEDSDPHVTILQWLEAHYGNVFAANARQCNALRPSLSAPRLALASLQQRDPSSPSPCRKRSWSRVGT